MTSTTAVKDPVCGMDVEATTASGQSTYKEHQYLFCGPNCKQSFDKSPEKYVGKPMETSKASHGCCG